MSDPQQAIETLRRFNQWRRGDESIEQPDPTEIGVAIDNAINLIKQRDMLAEALRNAEPHMRHNLNCNARLTDGELGCTCGMIKDRVAVINALAAVKGGSNE
jgi:hypothetical protein